MKKQELYDVVEDVIWYRALWAVVVCVAGVLGICGGIAIACIWG